MTLSNNDIINVVSKEDEKVSISNCNIEFIDIKKPDYKAKYLHISKCIIESYVAFKKIQIQNGLYFEECKFNDSVYFNDVSILNYDSTLNPESESLTFKDCEFLDKVIFINNTSFERSLVFDNCTFRKGIEINNLTITVEGIKFKNCTIDSKFDIFQVTTNQEILFISNTVNCHVRLHKIESGYLSFVENNIFNDIIHIDYCYLKRGLIFNNGIFKNEVKISVVKTDQTGLFTYGTTFEKAVFVEHHHQKTQPINGINKYNFTDTNFINGIYINGTNNFIPHNSIVDEIILDISSELKGDINFRNLDVGIISISGYNTSTNIILQDIYVNQIKMKALINNAGLIFSGIQASRIPWHHDGKNKIERYSAIYIDDTNLGKSQFFRVNFNSFNTIVFHNVILTEISTSLVNWFTPKQIDNGMEMSWRESLLKAKKNRLKRLFTTNFLSVIPFLKLFQFLDTPENKENIGKVKGKYYQIKDNLYNKLEKIQVYGFDEHTKFDRHKSEIINSKISLIADFNSKKEIYRQLKFASQKQGDITQSLVFQRWEMDYYRKIVNLKSPRDWSETITLWLSQTNDFNQNWIRALVFFLLFSFVFYIPIGFLTADYLDFTKINFSLDSIIFTIKSVCWDNLKIWIVLMNPTHRMSDIKENIQFYSSWIYLFDFLSRIVVSYFIFQIVSAFRKFNK